MPKLPRQRYMISAPDIKRYPDEFASSPRRAVSAAIRRAKLEGEWLPSWNLEGIEAKPLSGPELPAPQIRNSRRRARYLAKKEADRRREELEAWRSGGYLSERQPIPRNAHVYVPLSNRKAVDIWGKDPDTGFIYDDPRPYEDYADYYWEVGPEDPNYAFAREIGIGLPDMYNWKKLVLRPDSRNPAEFSGQTPYEVYHDPDYGWSNTTPADLGYKRWKTWRKFEPERYYESLEDY